METVRAKFVCTTIESDDKGNKYLTFDASTTEEGDGMDFTPYTPSGNLFINISGDVPAANFFEEGEVYHLDFSKAI